MIVFGVTQGMQPILGYNIGADNWNRVKETLRKGIICGLCITTSGWILTETLPDTISNLFTTDPQMIEIAREGFRVYFICYPVVGVQIVIQNFFQSIGKPKVSIFLSLTRQLIFLLPCLLFLPPFYGTDGVWYSFPIADGLAVLVSAVLLFWQLRKFRKYGIA